MPRASVHSTLWPSSAASWERGEHGDGLATMRRMPAVLRGRWRSALLIARRASPALQLVLDAGAWLVVVPLVVYARFDFVTTQVPGVRWLRFAALAVGVQIAAGLLFGLYRRRWRYATFEEASAAARAVVLTTAVMVVLNRWILVPRYVPLSVPIGAGFGALLFAGTYRYMYRLLMDFRRRPVTSGAQVQRALVFGAGEGATQLLSATLRDRNSLLVPVALLDDDHRKRRLTIRGVPSRRHPQRDSGSGRALSGRHVDHRHPQRPVAD